MKRPLQLTYNDTSLFGTPASKADVAGCYDHGWTLYQDLMESKWDHDDAIRAALNCIIANMTATINFKAEISEGEA